MSSGKALPIAVTAVDGRVVVSTSDWGIFDELGDFLTAALESDFWVRLDVATPSGGVVHEIIFYDGSVTLLQIEGLVAAYSAELGGAAV